MMERAGGKSPLALPQSCNAYAQAVAGPLQRDVRACLGMGCAQAMQGPTVQPMRRQQHRTTGTKGERTDPHLPPSPQLRPTARQNPYMMISSNNHQLPTKSTPMSY
jgi:hypothetical protein